MSEEDPLPEQFSDIYHSLRSRRRRYVIRELSQSEDEVLSVRDLAKTIAAIEQEIPQDHATGEPYRNVYNSLSQTHLPTLTEAGLIIYDPDRKTAEIGPQFQLALLFLQLNRATYRTLVRGELSENGDRRG